MWRFYTGLAMQLMGFASVGICLFVGIQKGDYGKVELAQFVVGMFLFYAGHFLRKTSK